MSATRQDRFSDFPVGKTKEDVELARLKKGETSEPPEGNPMRSMTTLLQIKDTLRMLQHKDRTSFTLDTAALATGYREMVRTAPIRAQGYLSGSRSGVPSGGSNSKRNEEHLAIALKNRGYLVLPEGERLKLIDYQFPLKAAHTDDGIGKIDLLGICPDGTLAVIELKLAKNGEDRRIALVEGLIYAAIVEANIGLIVAEIAAQIDTSDGVVARPVRPRVLLIGEDNFWRQPGCFSAADGILALIRGVAHAIPIEITVLTLNDVKVKPGGNGQPPLISGKVALSTL